MAAPDPLGAHTRGLGLVIAAALDAGAAALHVGLGGSGSTDGGTGALGALGARFLDETGTELPPGGAALTRLARVDTSGLRLPGVPATLWCDVTAPLTGPTGAAAVFGPQKGATPDDIRVLDAALGRLARVLGGTPEAPGAGAAGGTAYGFASLWDARVASGADTVAQLSGLDAHLAHADLVITGEGRLDASTATGKVVSAVTRLAEGAGAPLAYVVGQADPDAVGAHPVLTLTELAGSSAAAMADAQHWLRAAGVELARRHNVSGDLAV